MADYTCIKCGLCCREMMPDCKYLTKDGCIAGENKPQECKDFYCETHPLKAIKYLVKEVDNAGNTSNS